MPAVRTSFLRRNGPSLVLLALFLAFWAAQLATGHAASNQERLDQHLRLLSLLSYVRSGHFISATFEKWESEFLQMMGMYVLLTVSLLQQGARPSRVRLIRRKKTSASRRVLHRGRCVQAARGATSLTTGVNLEGSVPTAPKMLIARAAAPRPGFFARSRTVRRGR